MHESHRQQQLPTTQIKTPKLVTMVDSKGGNSNKGRQIPIVCPGHTRPLAELQFCYVKEENRTFLVSACHGKHCILVEPADNADAASLTSTY